MSKITQFIKEVRAVFKQITWPNRDTLTQLSFVVISISILLGGVLGGFDYLFTRSFTLLTQIKSTPPPQIEITPEIETIPESIESTDSANL